MRQAGYLAAACIYALDNHINRLKEDHIKARTLGEAFKQLNITEEVLPVDTNIVIISLKKAFTPAEVLEKLQSIGILGVPFGKQEIRLVTHLDFTDEQLDLAVENIKSLQL